MESQPIHPDQIAKAVDRIVSAPRYRENEDDRGEFLGRLKSGHEVYDRPDDSHMRSHGKVYEYLGRAFEQVDIKGDIIPNDRMDFVSEMGEVIGKTECVAVQEGDKVVYAIRKGRLRRGTEFTRFVLNREPEDCSSVVTVVYQPPVRDYLLLATAFIGRPAARELHEPYLAQRPDLKAKSLKFWMGVGGEDGDLGHALILDPEMIEPGTPVLSECPYDLSVSSPNTGPQFRQYPQQRFR